MTVEQINACAIIIIVLVEGGLCRLNLVKLKLICLEINWTNLISHSTYSHYEHTDTIM